MIFLLAIIGSVSIGFGSYLFIVQGSQYFWSQQQVFAHSGADVVGSPFLAAVGVLLFVLGIVAFVWAARLEALRDLHEEP